MATKWTARATKARAGRSAGKGKPKPLGKRRPGKAGGAAKAPPPRRGPAARKARPLRQGSGQALRQGSGQALRQGSGQALRQGSGQAGKEAVLAHHASRATPRKAVAGDANPVALDIAHAGLDKKAEDVTVLDVRGLTSYADFFVIMTADSDRQASAIADHVEQTMKGKGVAKVGVEGYETGRWILVDYGDVVAHVMSRESREFYDLDGLWADAPRLRVEG